MAPTIARPVTAVLVASLTVLAPSAAWASAQPHPPLHGTVLLPPARPSGGHAWLPLAVAQQGLLPTAPRRPRRRFPDTTPNPGHRLTAAAGARWTQPSAGFARG